MSYHNILALSQWTLKWHGTDKKDRNFCRNTGLTIAESREKIPTNQWNPSTISQKAPFLATWQDESSIKIDWTTRFWQYCGTLKKILFSKSEKSDNSMCHLETRNVGHYFTKTPFLATWQDESSIKIDWTTRFWQYCGTLKKILFSKSDKSDNSMCHLETRNVGHYFTDARSICIYIGSGDPVRVLRLLHTTNTLDTLWSIYCWDICTTCCYRTTCYSTGWSIISGQLLLREWLVSKWAKWVNELRTVLYGGLNSELV